MSNALHKMIDVLRAENLTLSAELDRTRFDLNEEQIANATLRDENVELDELRTECEVLRDKYKVLSAESEYLHTTYVRLENSYFVLSAEFELAKRLKQ